jgi:hypothetical protein
LGSLGVRSKRRPEVIRKLAAVAAISTFFFSVAGQALPAAAAPSNGVLRSAAARSSNDVWAAGYYYDGTVDRTLVKHWDGSGWNYVSTPSPGTGSAFFGAIGVVPSSSDVWAVGDKNNTTTKEDTGIALIERWNGSSWSAVSAPTLGTGHSILRAVRAVNANDVWAAGFYKPTPSSVDNTLVLHWNGASWSQVSSPNLTGGGNFLDALAVISATDIWAVGTHIVSGRGNRTLIEHWDGSSWTVVSSPSPGVEPVSYPHGAYLYGAAALASNDVWATGYYYDGTVDETLTLHWNGTSWSELESPNDGTGGAWLRPISAVSSSDIWSTGWYSEGRDETLTEHWNGSTWQLVISPNPGRRTSNYLEGVAAVAANDVWAVGFSTKGGVRTTLAEHWNGSNWSIIPS